MVSWLARSRISAKDEWRREVRIRLRGAPFPPPCSFAHARLYRNHKSGKERREEERPPTSSSSSSLASSHIRAAFSFFPPALLFSSCILVFPIRSEKNVSSPLFFPYSFRNRTRKSLRLSALSCVRPSFNLPLPGFSKEEAEFEEEGERKEFLPEKENGDKISLSKK